MPMKETIETRLQSAFQPEILEVIDESHLHAGHAGHREEGESHFRIKMTASNLEGKNRVAQHRAVNEALVEELKTIHALALELKTK